VVLTGGEPAKPLVNGTEEADLSFADRLSQLHPSSAQEATTAEQPVAVIPNASSLSTVLTQALNSSDEKLLRTCFQQQHRHETIHNTLMRLSPALVPTLLNYFNSTLSRKQKQAPATFDWIRQTVVIHGGYLVSQGEEVRQVLARLKGTLDRRGQSWERLVRLKGRLELLRAVKGEQGAKGGDVPEVRWVEKVPGEEAEEESEAEIEDVRYLTGDIEDEDGDHEIEGFGADAMQDAVENGFEDDEEEEEEEGDDEDDDQVDDEDEDTEEDPRVKKVNGVPHFSDSENSGVDLEDLIDDEASEASEDEDDGEEEDDEQEEEEAEEAEEAEEEEEEEEEEVEVPPPPPKKKSKSRR